MLLSEKLGKGKESRFLTYWEEEEEDKTHLVEEKETLPKPQTVKNEIGYIWWFAMPQQIAQFLFMGMDSWPDQWADELLKYTRPSPALLTTLPVKRLIWRLQDLLDIRPFLQQLDNLPFKLNSPLNCDLSLVFMLIFEAVSSTSTQIFLTTALPHQMEFFFLI